MARLVTIKVEGMVELAGMLEKVKATAQGHEVRAALLEGADMVRFAAVARAPIAPYPTNYKGRQIAPGGLRRSLMAAPGRQVKSFLQAFTFALKRLAPHAHLVERGTKAHVIVPKNKKWLKFGNRFTAFAKSVSHPGSRAQPFFSDAVRSQRNRIKKMLETRVKAAFDAIARAA